MHDRIPVLLMPEDYDRRLHGDFHDLLAFQNRCFPDALIDMTLPTYPWNKPRAAQAQRMAKDLTPQEAIQQLGQHFGGREGMMLHQLTVLSTSGQPADITFYRRRPILDVRVSTKISAARLYGLESHIPRLLRRIEFSNGVVSNLKDIWTINPMPVGGFTQEELDAADMSQGDERSGPQGETVRKMIRKSYHCKSSKETEYYLRRWIAS